ncbi:MAG: LacI family DNA-binding transcriptional regulator [Bryobacterales bacterium]|nr:LacI family DNA-binding transcriptional regulator [Bryobacterales bacterium]
MATIYDVAKRAKVSTYTVSAVINRSAYVSPELTERVLLAVKELDYTPNELARGLPTRKTRTIGMLIPDIANPFYGKVVRGVEDRLREDGYSLILGNTYNNAEHQTRYLNLFRAKQTDGFVLFPSAGAEQEIERLVTAKRPVVFVGRLPKAIAADSVTADNIKGGRLVTEYLVKQGHKRIAIASGQRTLSASADRINGWRQALRKAKLPVRDEYIGEGDWTAESGRTLTHQFLNLPEPPTAVFAANFLMMTGVLRALRERNLTCPDDVEVVSSDDSDWLDVFGPPISTVVTDSYAMGYQAAELLLKRIEKPGRKPQNVLLSPELRVRKKGVQQI